MFVTCAPTAAAVDLCTAFWAFVDDGRREQNSFRSRLLGRDAVWRGEARWGEGGH